VTRHRFGVSMSVSVALLSVIVWPSRILAQGTTAAISGVVLDARTRQPLAGAIVELSNPLQSVTTDAEGRFRFEAVPVGSGELLVSLVGYAFAKYAVEVPAEGANVTISLTEGTAAYHETVSVTGDIFGVREIGVAGQQSLGSAELRQLSGMTLDDPLRAVQALSGANASDDFYGEVAVRGNGFRQLTYTLDGVPARFLVHTIKFVEDGGSVTMINSDVLSQVSLLRGAYSQRFDQGLGAALDFTSSKGSRERTRYNLTASGTSAEVTADGPLGASTRGSWLVSARRSYLDQFLKRVLSDSSQAFGFTDLFSKVVYDLSEHHQIQAGLLVGRSLFDKDPEQLRNSPRNLGRATHVGWMATAAWRHTPSPKVVVAHRLFMTGESYDNANGLNEQVATGRATDYGYRTDLSYTPGTGRVIETGWSFERLGARQQNVFQVPGWHILGGEDFASHAQKVGAYGQLHWAVGPLTVTPGARVDRFGLTGDWTASPWLQADWKASADLTVVFNAGLHHQFPEFEQIVGRRGDVGLHPERASNVDAGVEGRFNATTRWQVTVFDREERDVLDLPDQYYRRIDGVLRTPSAMSRYANRLDGFSRGVELMLQRKSPDALSGWIAYSFGRTRDTDRVTGETFDGDFDQRHTLSLFGRYRLSDRMSVNARWRFGSNRPIAGYIDREPNGDFLVGSARNAIRVPAYSRLDARVDRTYRWGSRRLTLFAEVANFLNRENFRQVPPSIDIRSGEAFGPLASMFPIVPSIGATLEF
jgi:carboxypeptidase family protein/TonB-dependent receptor-like protein